MFFTLGYVLGLILEACIQYQSATSHVDILHVNAHFLRTTFTTAFTVCIRTVKRGAGYTNVTADLIQDVRAIFLFIRENELISGFNL
jgi:hypothetical protein